MAVTERELARIQARVQQAHRPLRSAAAIGQAVGAVLGRRHMAKHFQISIADDAFSFAKTLSASPPSPPSTASKWSAPTCRRRTPMPPLQCAPARASVASSTLSAH
ncbi:MAG TPA: hypothetical protein VHT00_11535 [Stellaceae bacterium]|nr:hypothetical protein [Stellaceae bacterium]HEX3418544.1 hypothetical protein [Stellaceae bacterium]